MLVLEPHHEVGEIVARDLPGIGVRWQKFDKAIEHRFVFPEHVRFLERLDLIEIVLHGDVNSRALVSSSSPLSRPKAMIDLLRNHPRRENCRFVFPSPAGNREWHMLDHCKEIAKRGKVAPAKFDLKTFRSTYATRMLRAGFDVRTVQHWMGTDHWKRPCVI